MLGQWREEKKVLPLESALNAEHHQLARVWLRGHLGTPPPLPGCLLLNIIAPPEDEQVSVPRNACSRLVRQVLQFCGLQLSSL